MITGNSDNLVLEVLTDNEELVKLCQRYWEIDEDGSFLEKVSAICKDVGISQAKLTKLVGENSYTYFESYACPSCWTPTIFQSRSALLHKGGTARVCDACVSAEAAMEAELKITLLVNAEKRALGKTLLLNQLDLEQVAYLLALIKFAGTEDLSEIGEYGLVKTGMLTPSKTFDIDLLRTLYSNKVIYLSPASNLDAFTVTDGSEALSFKLDWVRWKIPVQNGLSPYMSIYSCLESILKDSAKEANTQAIRALCEKIALEECLAYLQMALNEHRLGYEFGEKTKSVINAALETFSVAEVYNFIWRAAKDAAAFYLRSARSRDHASKIVPGSIELQCERALADGWQIKPFSRNFNLPQSSLSRVVYNTLLGTNDGGFNMKNSDVLVVLAGCSK